MMQRHTRLHFRFSNVQVVNYFQAGKGNAKCNCKISSTKSLSKQFQSGSSVCRKCSVKVYLSDGDGRVGRQG